MAKKKSIEQKVKELEEQLRALTRKSKDGRPTLFDEKQINLLETACSFPGITQEQVCALLDVDDSTLRKFINRRYKMSFSRFREQKAGKLNFQLLAKQVEVAMGSKADPKNIIPPNVSMLIWLGKNRLNQKDSHETTISSDSASPFQLIINAPKQD